MQNASWKGGPINGTNSSLYHNQPMAKERVISSQVISESHTRPLPEDSVRVIEVPFIEEHIRHVPRKEIVELERTIPRVEIQWVEKFVEVPQIQYVEKFVEVPQVQEIIKHVPIRQVIDIQKEVVRYVPKVEIKHVEQIVEIPGETIEVEKKYLVENRIVVPKFVDKEVATVVSQRLQPVIVEASDEFIDVTLKQYDPVLIPIDVFVPKPVERSLVAAARYDTCNVVQVPPAQWNGLLRTMNGQFKESWLEEIMVKEADGSIPLLSGIGTQIVEPINDDWKTIITTKNEKLWDFKAPTVQDVLQAKGNSAFHQSRTSTSALYGHSLQKSTGFPVTGNVNMQTDSVIGGLSYRSGGSSSR